jgi:hypothetical protein
MAARTGIIIVVVIVVAILFSFFVPVFPTTSQSGSLFGATYQVNAEVSLTFLVSHCGSYVDAHSTLSAGGVQVVHPLSSGYNFQCSYSSSSASSTG